RDVNIAVANELARVANDYGISSRDAIDLANVHPRVDVHRRNDSAQSISSLPIPVP
ncbi:hypothetical protein GJ632_08100, partial [Halogeometricum sp. CBA1124]|nr:hypothetical protein [Halogeometricum sp. CBA1124]